MESDNPRSAARPKSTTRRRIPFILFVLLVVVIAITLFILSQSNRLLETRNPVDDPVIVKGPAQGQASPSAGENNPTLPVDPYSIPNGAKNETLGEVFGGNQDGIEEEEEQDEDNSDESPKAEKIEKIHEKEYLDTSLATFFTDSSYPETCVRHVLQSRDIEFNLPDGDSCTKKSVCIFRLIPSNLLTTMHNLIKARGGIRMPIIPPEPAPRILKKSAKCGPSNETLSHTNSTHDENIPPDSGAQKAICRVPYRSDKSGSSMVVWSVQFQTKDQIYKSYVNYLNIGDHRPFVITSVFDKRDDLPENHFMAVGYFFPRLVSPTLCNKLYCVYRDTKTGKIEEYAALPGDISFTFCPHPSRKMMKIIHNPTTYVKNSAPGNYKKALDVPPSHITLSITYDHLHFTLPYVFGLSVKPNNLNPVHMSICAIVKQEGSNLLEWIEYHRVMGYSRFIIYDNNPPQAPDMKMISILRMYPHLDLDPIEVTNAYQGQEHNATEYISPRPNIIKGEDNMVIRIAWPYRHGQTEALTDCIQRFGSSTKWMTFIDVDEYLAPSRHFVSITEVLAKKFERIPYIFSTWLVFGPCDSDRIKPGALISQICNNIMDNLRWVPKPTFQTKLTAGIQGYSPHHVRLIQDWKLGQDSESQIFTDPSIYVYHYRFRTWGIFMKKRVGDTAGRVLERSPREVRRMWLAAQQKSRVLVDPGNRVLRFAPVVLENLKAIKAMMPSNYKPRRKTRKNEKGKKYLRKDGKKKKGNKNN